MTKSRQKLPSGFGTLWSTVALDLLGFGIVIPLLPIYAERFGAGGVAIGWLVAVYSLAQLIVSPILGRLSDRIGRKPVLIFSLVGSAIGSLLTGFATSLWMLFAGRIVDGGSGASIAVAQAAAADMAEPEERPRLMGLLGAAFGLGFVVGPAIGGLASLVTPELPFIIAGSLAAINAVAAWKRLPDSKPVVVEPPEPEAASSPLTSGVRRLLILAFASLVAFAGFETTFSLLMEDRFGLTQAGVGLVFTGIGLALAAVQGGLVARVHKVVESYRILQIAMTLLAAGLVLLTAANGWPLLVLALGLIVVGYGLISPTISVELSSARESQRGAVLGIQQSANAGARIVGPVLGGVLFEHLATGAPYFVGAIIVAVALAVVTPTRTAERVKVDA